MDRYHLRGPELNKTLFAGGLIALAIVQIGSRQWWHGPPPSGPIVGDSLPPVAVTTLAGGIPITVSELANASAGCDVVFLMSAYCAHCARMRYSWSDTYRLWVDSVGITVRAVWVMREDSATTARFVEGFDLTGVILARLTEGAEAAWRHRLGVVGTPMAYLVDRRGVVQAGIMGPRFPAASRAREVCAGD